MRKNVLFGGFKEAAASKKPTSFLPTHTHTHTLELSKKMFRKRYFSVDPVWFLSEAGVVFLFAVPVALNL